MQNLLTYAVFKFEQKLTLSTILKLKKPSFPVYFGNLEGSALFQQKAKSEYLRPTQFFPGFLN